MRWVIAAVVLVAGTASADDGVWKAGPYEIVVSGKRLDVRTGKRRATVAVRAGWRAVHVAGTQVTIDYDGCKPELPQHESYTFEQLEARLENFEALIQHRAKDWTHAAEGFAKAVALDPTWRLPAYNLASARTRMGDHAGARAALAPWLRQDLVGTYAAIAQDPELQPLLADPELVAMRASHPGTLKVARNRLGVDAIGYSPDKGLLLRERSLAGWGYCNWNSDLEVLDATGKTVAAVPFVSPDDYIGLVDQECQPMDDHGSTRQIAKHLAARFDAFDRAFADLGFVAAEVETASLDRNDEHAKATFDKSKLGVVRGKDGTGHVLRGNATIANTIGDGVLTYVPAVKLVLARQSGQNEDGCPTESYSATPIP